MSVIAVKIQFSSPSGVRLSFNRPGTLERNATSSASLLLPYLSIMSWVIPDTRLRWPILWSQYHKSAVLMGVVKHEEKRSAGSVGLMGNSSLGPQDAS